MLEGLRQRIEANKAKRALATAARGGNPKDAPRHSLRSRSVTQPAFKLAVARNSSEGFHPFEKLRGNHSEGKTFSSFSFSERQDLITEFNGKFRGVLAGQGHLIVDAAHKYNVDPKLFASMIAFETGWGTSPKIRKLNNVAGLYNSEEERYFAYATLSEGIDAAAKNLRTRYIDRGITTIPAIARVYAPVGALNDPNGTNGTWPRDVSKIYQNFL